MSALAEALAYYPSRLARPSGLGDKRLPFPSLHLSYYFLIKRYLINSVRIKSVKINDTTIVLDQERRKDAVRSPHSSWLVLVTRPSCLYVVNHC